jgi:TolB-like protein/predicted Ser/Thr protein kinase
MIGKILDHYKIVEKIGQGGMGEVFLAEDTSLHRKVALKFLPPDMQRDETAHKRFIREARSAAALDHPYICSIHEVGESDGRDFIVMEYVDGQSLKDRLLQGPLPTEEGLILAIEVAEALEAAHAKGIIHRDIKPGNVMLTQTGHAKVMDFGLAKQMFPAGGMESAAETATALTTEGATVGTLAYMSPEQLRSQTADARSDIWALGVTLYEMAAGARPFQGQSGFELSSAILNQAPQPLPPGVPAELGAVIERCLEKEPGKRYQQAGEVRAALEAVRAGTVVPWVAWHYWLKHHPWLVLTAAAIVLAATLVGLDVGGLRERLTGRSGGQARAVRLAVLPFENLTGDADQEYLSDGLTQEMIVQLGGLHPASLSVIARMSVMRYKKRDKPVDEVGRELNVDYILGGSARREGGRIRITVELIKVSSQTQLWAETYERELAGVLALQSEVARKVAGSLALKLLPEEQARLAHVRQVNPEAYEAYLKGMQQWYKGTRASFDTALQYFESAIARDPNFAPAHAGVANIWLGRSQYGLISHVEAALAAKVAAQKAVELGEDLPETHSTLANIKTWSEWDWAGGEREYRRAIELDPSSGARLGLSHLLLILQHPREAMEQIDRALEVDPFNVLAQSFRAVNLMKLKRYDEAIAQARETLRAAPGEPSASSALTQALYQTQTEEEYVAEWRERVSLNPAGLPLFEVFERGYKEGGYRAGWKRLAEYRAAGFGKTHWNPTRAASSYVKAGENALALDWLEKAFEAHDPNLPYVFIGPGYDPLRSEPRFQSLRRKMNLPL